MGLIFTLVGLTRCLGRYQNSVGSARKVVRLLEEYGKGVSQGAKH